jgi:hypothetical protein
MLTVTFVFFSVIHVGQPTFNRREYADDFPTRRATVSVSTQGAAVVSGTNQKSQPETKSFK